MDLPFGPEAPAGKSSNWALTDPNTEFEIQFQLDGRYDDDAPADGPDWGMRFTDTLLWPH